MSDSETSSPLDAEIVSIAEAAQRLGVSERTVYRLLRAGRLRRVPSDILSDKCLTVVSIYYPIEGIQGQKSRLGKKNVRQNEDNVRQVADSKWDGVVEQLRVEIRRKDEQIARMLEVQGEMTQTIQQLQAQMYELARLVLTQKVRDSAPEAPEKVTKEPEPSKTQARKWSLFRRSDNNSQER